MFRSEQTAVKILYTSWRGETRERLVQPFGIRFHSTEWHPEPQWLLMARDLEAEDEKFKDFAMKDIKSWTPAEAPRRE